MRQIYTSVENKIAIIASLLSPDFPPSIKKSSKTLIWMAGSNYNALLRTLIFIVFKPELLILTVLIEYVTPLLSVC